MGVLYKIQNDVQSIAEVIAAALKVETEIIDDEGRVLGATGRIRGQLLTKRTDTHINNYVITKARPFILNNPGTHKLCQPCSDREECCYTGGLFYPINVKGKCQGVISLVSFSALQNQILMENQSSFLDFIGKMAGLLATKLQETLIMDQNTRFIEYLEAIIHSVYEGVIACDENGIITCYNQTAERILGIAKSEVIGNSITQILPPSNLIKCLSERRSITEEKVQYPNASGETINLISNATIIKDENRVLGAVESFTEEEKIFRVAHRFSSREQGTAFDNIIGNSNVIRKIKLEALKVAQSSSTILITGESGTGKELFARAIHSASPRAGEPFIAINCSAIPETLLESELFGYEKGAFTGAKSEGKPGKFELANGGTIFLDEIGDMPLHLQVKMLRVLQERVIQRVGGVKNIPVNVRVIAATHRNLKEMIEKNQFREDLYYRINVIPLQIPPLRERTEDLPVLIDYLSKKYSDLLNKAIAGISEDALRILLKYRWRGNVRELENAIEYAVNFAPDGGLITNDFLPSWLFNIESEYSEDSYRQKLEKTERQILEDALQTMGSSVEAKEQIAGTMGISLTTLYRKLRKYNLI